MVELRSAIGLLGELVEWYVTASQTGELDRPATAGDDRPSSIQLAIVPKGLHSFDAGDSKFFLKLLPGPFHDDGLPESIHFWKEAVEKEVTFTVGLIHGRSGRGKSSLVKAGLLPRLADNVKRVYLEATADKTEEDLREKLRTQFPSCRRTSTWKRLSWPLTAASPWWEARKSRCWREGKGVHIVIDQFEQWFSC